MVERDTESVSNTGVWGEADVTADRVMKAALWAQDAGLQIGRAGERRRS